MRAAMDRHERFRSELAAGFEAEKKKANLDWKRALECLDRRRDVSLAEYDRRYRGLQRAIKDLEESVLSCRSREAAATARVSLLRELASAGNPAGLDVAPSYSRGRDETSHKEPDAPLEPAQPDFATRASKETNKFEPIFGLHNEMDEFRRLKVMHLTTPTRELAECQVFAEAMAAHREDGRGSEDRAKTIVETLVTTSSGAGTTLARTSRTPPIAAPMADLLRDPGDEDEADGSGRLRQSRS
ncbi:unnamed protein product [Ascophyllum nodosum]